MTNSLEDRIQQHKEGVEKGEKSFTARYRCVHLVHYEHFQYVNDAIAREKEIKKWNRKKKEELIETENPEWKFLEEDLFD